MRKILFGLLAVLALVGVNVGAGKAAEPPIDPVLRIETGMHTAMINRIGVDQDEKLLLTGSDDKTARLWSLPDGRLLRVLRPPLGDGDEGKLYAAALSPDGKLAAVAGWTGQAWDNMNAIYLFDTASGALTRRLTGLPSVVNHLAFSPNGRHLAAGLGGENGMRAWETAGWREVLADRDYGARVQGLAFAADGRLAASSYDGAIRLYDRDLKLARKLKATGGERPFGVAFSPDGGKLAVGYRDVKRVEVLDGQDLRLLFRPDVAGGDNDSMSSVAWSADGRYLFAGGMWRKDGKGFIRRWADGGRGGVADLSVAADSTIMDLKPWGRDGVLFGSGDPAWGALGGAGKAIVGQTAVIADFRNNLEGFAVDRDGRRVRFGLKVRGKEPQLFDVAARSLDAAPTPPSGLSPPRTAGLNVTDWRDSTAPKLDGKPLALRPYEIARSLAVAPAADHFLLGTEWRLRLFDTAGKQLWEKPAPDVTWGVNISGDGKLAVAAYGDGTIRWRKMSDGQELLALFVDAQDKRWVAWTPKGYYMASPGGENLIGWHVNNGKDAAADFFNAGRFREVFNRPDVVERVLTTLDEAEALRQADAAGNRRRQDDDIRAKLPPVVEILSPAPGSAFSSQTATLRYRVRSPSGLPVTRVRTLIDGQSPSEAARGVGRPDAGGGEYTVSVSLPPRDVTVGLVAETEYGAGEVASVALKWTGATAADLTKPKLYAVLVGTAAYTNPKVSPLRWAAQDARDMADALTKQKGRLYRDVEIRLVADGGKDAALDALEWLQRSVTSRDVGLVFLSGHGHNDNYGDYWYLPRDGDPDALRRTALRSSEFKEVLSKLPGKALMLVDTCHAAQSGAERTRSAVDASGFVSELAAADSGVVMFTSSTGKQLSVERDEWRNGAFTEALVEALGDDKADIDRNGAVTLAELDQYLAERVKALTDGRQSPVMIKAAAIPNIPIAMTRR